MKNQIILIIIILLLYSCSNENKHKISLSGTLEAIEATISSKVNGEIINLLIDEGSKVSPGDTLAIIDKTDYELQYRQALAGQRVAEAQYNLLITGTRKEDLKQAEENLKQTEANLKNAEEDFKRIENLFISGSVSIKQKDDTQTRLEIAQAQYNSAKQLYEKLKTGAQPEEIAAAKARYDQASAQADVLKKKINDCIIISPISGFITKRLIEKGELVGIGMPLFRLANLDEMHIMVYLPETQLGKIKLGIEAEVTIDSYPDKIFYGEVVFISPEAEFTPKNIQTMEERVKLVFGVKVKVSNPEYLLKAGLPADVLLNLENK